MLWRSFTATEHHCSPRNNYKQPHKLSLLTNHKEWMSEVSFKNWYSVSCGFSVTLHLFSLLCAVALKLNITHCTSRELSYHVSDIRITNAASASKPNEAWTFPRQIMHIHDLIVKHSNWATGAVLLHKQLHRINCRCHSYNNSSLKINLPSVSSIQ